MPARHHAESRRLARVLGVPDHRLSFLREVATADVAALHLASRDLLRSRHRPLYRRLARTSHLLPVSLAAWIAEHALGPLLCARIAAEMGIPATTLLCQHLSPPFMAEVCPYMDVETLSRLALQLPRDTLREIARHLIERGEHIVLGELADTLPDELLQRMAESFGSADTVLRISLFMEQADRIEYLLSLLPLEELPALSRVAADPRRELLPEALSLLQRVSPEWRRRLLDAAIADGDGPLESLLREVDRLGLWRDALPLTSLLDRAGRWRLLQLPLWRDADLRRRALRQAARPLLLPHARILLGTLPPDERERALHALEKARARTDG